MSTLKMEPEAVACSLAQTDYELGECFAQVRELAAKLRAAERAHHEYEQKLGARDEDWPTFYAAHVLGKPVVAEIVARNHHSVDLKSESNWRGENL